MLAHDLSEKLTLTQNIQLATLKEQREIDVFQFYANVNSNSGDHVRLQP